ncbi:hypothetical protein Ddc_03660 [Ditylenchus destructor]|nr:hypothetical protein Ddc_03660 [Ditylenchus destructor]
MNLHGGNAHPVMNIDSKDALHQQLQALGKLSDPTTKVKKQPKCCCGLDSNSFGWLVSIASSVFWLLTTLFAFLLGPGFYYLHFIACAGYVASFGICWALSRHSPKELTPFMAITAIWSALGFALILFALAMLYRMPKFWSDLINYQDNFITVFNFKTGDEGARLKTLIMLGVAIFFEVISVWSLAFMWYIRRHYMDCYTLYHNEQCSRKSTISAICTY